MWRSGPKPGILIAADPATVERSGFAIRESRRFHRPHGAAAQSAVQPEKPLELQCDQPGPDASHSTNRPPLRSARRLQSCNMASKLREGEADPFGPQREVRDAVSQETCHPQGPVFARGPPDPGRDTPDASTEVVMALSSRSRGLPFISRPAACDPSGMC